MPIIYLLLLTLPHFIFFHRYSLIYQQQYYETSRYLLYFKQNSKKQFLFLSAACLLAALEILLLHWHDWYLAIAIVNLSSFLLLFQKRIIKLKYTKRILRLLINYFLINFAAILIFYLILGIFSGFITAFTTYLLSPLILVVIKTINQPLEIRIRKKYLKEGQIRLKQFPQLIVIGITGSYGKTTVKNILAGLLGNSYNVLYAKDSINTPLGLTKMIREKLDFTHQVFIAEMGIDRVGGMDKLLELITCNIGVVTSIGPQHLATFKTLENIKKEKLKLLQSINLNGNVVMNADDPVIADCCHIDAQKHFYGIHNDCQLQAINICYTSNGLEFALKIGEEIESGFSSKLLGEHNIYNILASIQIALLLKIPLTTIKSRLKRIAAPAHRLEPIFSENKIILDDSYNSNPVGFRSALKVLKEFNMLRILITPGLVEQGSDSYRNNYQLATEIATSCDLVLLVSENAKPIADGLREIGFANFYMLNSLRLAKQEIAKLRDKQMVILIENDLPDVFLS